MKQNDLPLLIGIAMALLMGFVGILLAKYATSSTAASWTGSIFTAIAVAVALWMPIHERRKRHTHDENIATMRVAARLRTWMRIVADGVSDNQTKEDSNGHLGNEDYSIPEIGLDVDTVATLTAAKAKEVYSLMELRERAISQLRHTADFVDNDEAIRIYYYSMALLFLRARKLYRKFAKETGLHERTSHKWELEAINRAATDGEVSNWRQL